MKYTSLKNALLSMAYLLVVMTILTLVKILFGWLFNNYISSLLNQFNELDVTTLIKGCLFGGILSVLIVITFFFTRICTSISHYILRWFPANKFIYISSFILSIINSVIIIIAIWKTAYNYNFWTIGELLILSIFVVSLNSIVIGNPDRIRKYENK